MLAEPLPIAPPISFPWFPATADGSRVDVGGVRRTYSLEYKKMVAIAHSPGTYNDSGEWSGSILGDD